MNLRERIQTELAGVEQVTKEQMAKIEQAEKDIKSLHSALALNVGRASGLRTVLAMLDEPAIAEEEAKRAVDQINEILDRTNAKTADQPKSDPLSLQAMAKKYTESKRVEPISGPLDVRFDGEAVPSCGPYGKKDPKEGREPITVRGNEIAKPPLEKDHAQHLNCGNCGSRECGSYCLDAPVR